ncbi:MAG: ATP-binding protein [Solimonas sp.]
MIGLALRITSLLLATLLLAAVAIFATFYFDRGDQAATLLQAPLGERIGAIVDLLEQVPPSDAPRVVRAASSPEFRVQVRPGPLPPALQGRQYPRIAALIRHSNETLQDRRLLAGPGGDAGKRPPRSGLDAARDDGFDEGRPLHVAVELRDGRVLDLDIRGTTLRRTLARPFGLLAILLVGGIGLAALWALRTQIRPLEALAREVERVGTAAEGPPLREHGAREVRQLVAAFNRMRRRLHGMIEGRTRMLAAISHDLGTYLTRLRLRIEWIADAEQRTRAEQDLADMQHLLADTLALARSGQPGEAVREPVDLVALAERELRERNAGGGAVTLEAPATLVVPGHALSLARVLGNLVGNALKYGRCAGIRLAPLDADAPAALHGGAEIRVDDDGPGIPAAEREAVLEPFYRRDHARNLDEAGSGLGLAIVADIVRRHGGELHLEDRPGGGLRVRVRLPG